MELLNLKYYRSQSMITKLFFRQLISWILQFTKQTDVNCKSHAVIWIIYHVRWTSSKIIINFNFVLLSNLCPKVYVLWDRKRNSVCIIWKALCIKVLYHGTDIHLLNYRYVTDMLTSFKTTNKLFSETR